MAPLIVSIAAGTGDTLASVPHAEPILAFLVAVGVGCFAAALYLAWTRLVPVEFPAHK